MGSGIVIPKSALVRLYQDEHLSTYAIATRYHCDPKTIYRHLKLNGISPRPKKLITLDRGILRRLYIEEKKSLREIAEAHGYSPTGILKKMVTFGLQRRSISETSTKHTKYDFDGSKKERAYLIGFRLGDLGVRDRKNLIYISSGTTKEAQAKLIHNLFAAYGPVWIGKKNQNRAMNVSCSVNRSFEFLLPKYKKIPLWIQQSPSYFLSFLAGYTDAEGNFGIAGGTARFRIRSCDKGILRDIRSGLSHFGVTPLFGIDRPRGIDRRGVRLNRDCWGIAVNGKHDLIRLLSVLVPLLRHQKRIADARHALQNVIRRTFHKNS